MPEVDVTINRRVYRIACGAGEEDRLRLLGREIDQRIQNLVSDVGQVGNDRLLAMASIVIADELMDAVATLAEANLEPRASAAPLADPALRDAATAAEIEAVAQRLEGIADSLEQT